MKPLVIYHDHCCDGFGAAFAAWMKFGDEAEYLPMSYGATPDIETWHMKYAISQREVYVLDFSFDRVTTEYLIERAERFVWLDHHKTAFEMWLGNYEKGLRHLSEIENDYILLDDNKSGAMLAWRFFPSRHRSPDNDQAY